MSLLPSTQAFEDWRDRARRYLAAGVSPDRVDWRSEAQLNLFDAPAMPDNAKLSVPRSFPELARAVACHRDDDKWSLLYQALWRLTHGEPHLLHLATDLLVHRLKRMEQSVRRDAHKAKAFVRFRLLQENDEDHYIAWHQSDHLILGLVAPFFQRRFAVMKWSVLTPDESVTWNGEHMFYGDGVPAAQVKHGDDFEDIWRVYYRATFNPARIKIAMMKREMPVRYWATLPETDLIDSMLAEADTRVAAMIAQQAKTK